MRRFSVAGMVIVALAILPQTALGADRVAVSELVESGSEFDGAELIVEGELIGDYGFRGDGHMWTQLNDDQYVLSPIREGGIPSGGNTGIGVRVPADLGYGLDPPGRYRTRGPVVRVTGTWRFHDEERSGESYLDVVSLSVVEPGRPLDDPADGTVTMIGLALLGVSVLLWATRSRDRR